MPSKENQDIDLPMDPVESGKRAAAGTALEQNPFEVGADMDSPAMAADQKERRHDPTHSGQQTSSNECVRDFMDQVVGLGEDVRKLAGSAGEPIEEYVKESPIKSILIAAVVGVVLGCCARLMNRER